MKSAVSRPRAAPVPNDGPLLDLSSDFELAWLAERRVFATEGVTDEACEAAADATSAIVQRIIETPADSLDCLRVKARAISWCYDGEAFDPAELTAGATGEATANRLAASLVEDVFRMVGVETKRRAH